MEQDFIIDGMIDVSKIPPSPRYFYPVSYIFPGEYYTCGAFEKKDESNLFHIQEFYEICIITKGEGHHVIEDTVVNAVRGDVFIVPPGRKHAFIGGKGFNVYYIHLSPVFLEHNTPRLKDLPAFFSLFEIEPLMRVKGEKYRHLYLEENVLRETLDILDVISNHWQYDPATHLMQESYCVIALTILCREYEKLQTTVGKNAYSDRLFMDSVKMILHNCSAKLTIEELAQTAGLSRTSYIKRFSEVMGMSPRRFIMSQRISIAKNLLKSTDKPITKIAEETGFYDTAHFSKCFQNAEGVSPTEFRSKVKG